MEPALHSLHRAYPGEYLAAVSTNADALFEHHPNVVPAGPDFEEVDMQYPLIHQCNQTPVSFLEGYCQWLADKIGRPVPLVTNRPHLYVSDQEKAWLSQVQELGGQRNKFWLVNAGWKDDFSTKRYQTDSWQKVVDHFRGRLLFVQIGERDGDGHHPPLRHVINLVGKTDVRQLVRLAWHAQGGLGGVTFLQHVMAGHGKPYVCLLGGREPLAWVGAYPRQTVLRKYPRTALTPCFSRVSVGSNAVLG
jgi:ADP-heptose:LPS heptosyltransferase